MHMNTGARARARACAHARTHAHTHTHSPVILKDYLFLCMVEGSQHKFCNYVTRGK